MTFSAKSGIIVGLFVLSVVAVSGASISRQAQPTPLELFQRMLPAMRHPRCNNCHGVVDPETGANHGGGRIAADTSDSTHQECDECHSAASEWQIPGSEHFFDGRTDKQICNQVADFVSTFGRSSFITHATNDDQIKQAFLGLAAGARVPGLKSGVTGKVDPPADPPSMTHEQFIQAAKDWVNQGNAACALDGMITWEESVTSADTFSPAPALSTVLSQTGSRIVTVTAVGGQFRADITVKGEVIDSHTLKGGSCTVITIVRNQYSGHTTGPATVTIKDTAFRVSPIGDHRIDITLPPEQTVRTTKTTVQNDCRMGIPAPTDTTETFNWPAWDYTIEGYLADVRATHSIGGCSKTVLLSEVAVTQPANVCNRFKNMGNANEPWLVNHGGVGSYHNGKPIPFQVNVSWNIRRR